MAVINVSLFSPVTFYCINLAGDCKPESGNSGCDLGYIGRDRVVAGGVGVV